MSKRIAALFVVALAGLLVVIGVALASLGWWVLGPYLALVAVGVVLSARRARALRSPAVSEGNTCTCCTSTVYDPIEVR